MKKLFRSGFSILALTAVFASCSSDDNSTEAPTKPGEEKPGEEKPGDNGLAEGKPGKYTLTEGHELSGLKIVKGQEVTLPKGGTYYIGKPANKTASFTTQNAGANGGILSVEDGAKLIIEEGTTIISKGETNAHIVVKQGGQIFVNGTKEKPVTMTTDLEKRGSWGGLVILGKAPINGGAETATAEVGIEYTYGGSDAEDYSGEIKYLRILYGGAALASEKEFNGLTFYAVGSKTKVEYVQAHEGSDDGFEWFGGTVSASHLVSTHNDDDQFDWAEGWIGQENKNWYSKQQNSADKGFEADNNGTDNSLAPFSNPTVDGITLIGSNTGDKTAFKLREGTKGHLKNVVISGWKTGIDVEHDQTIKNAKEGSLKIENIQFLDVQTKSKVTDSNKKEVKDVSIHTEKNNNGAGNGANVPEWAKGWTVGL